MSSQSEEVNLLVYHTGNDTPNQLPNQLLLIQKLES